MFVYAVRGGDAVATIMDVLGRHGLALTEDAVARFLEQALAGRTVPRGPRQELEPERALPEAEARALERAGWDLSPRGPVARTVAEHAALLAGTVSVAEAARTLGVDATRVRHRIADRKLFAFRVGREWRLPTVQFGVPAIEGLWRHVPEGLNPLVVYRWLHTPQPELEWDGRGLTPLEWLSVGGPVQPVAALAADL